MLLGVSSGQSADPTVVERLHKLSKTMPSVWAEHINATFSGPADPLEEYIYEKRALAAGLTTEDIKKLKASAELRPPISLIIGILPNDEVRAEIGANLAMNRVGTFEADLNAAFEDISTELYKLLSPAARDRIKLMFLSHLLEQRIEAARAEARARGSAAASGVAHGRR